MKKYKFFALYLAIAAPSMAHAATDGTLGPTSTGTFAVNVSVTPDTSNYVQITNMFDLNLPPISAAETTDTVVNNYLCLLKNTPGPVRLSIGQTNGSSEVPPSQFSLVDPETKAFSRITMMLGRVGSPSVQVENGIAINTQASSPSCTGQAAATDNGGFKLVVTVPAPAGDPSKVGNLSGVFNLLLSPG